jgi:hypothetical protein
MKKSVTLLGALFLSVIGHEDDHVGFFVVRRRAAMRPVLRRRKALQLLVTAFPYSS